MKHDGTLSDWYEGFNATLLLPQDTKSRHFIFFLFGTRIPLHDKCFEFLIFFNLINILNYYKIQNVKMFCFKIASINIYLLTKIRFVTSLFQASSSLTNHIYLHWHNRNRNLTSLQIEDKFKIGKIQRRRAIFKIAWKLATLSKKSKKIKARHKSRVTSTAQSFVGLINPLHIVTYFEKKTF